MATTDSSKPDSSKPPARRPSARQARERLRQLGALIEAQAALGWGLILLLMALLGVIYLNQTSRIATVGHRVQVLQRDLNRLKLENSDLERQIAAAQTLPHLQREAARLGYSQAEPDEIEYIIVPNYPAGGEVSEVGIGGSGGETAVLAPPPATLSEALQLALMERINRLMQGEARE
jgi:cell division protein FtsB